MERQMFVNAQLMNPFYSYTTPIDTKMNTTSYATSHLYPNLAAYQHLPSKALPKPPPKSLKDKPKRRSPLSRSVTTNFLPVPRTIYSLKPTASLTRSHSLPHLPPNTASNWTSLEAPKTPPRIRPSRSTIWVNMPSTPPESRSPELKPTRPQRRRRTLEWACDNERERKGTSLGSPPRDLDHRRSSFSTAWDSFDDATSTSTSTTTEDEMEVFTPNGSFAMSLPEIIVTSPEELDQPIHSIAEQDAAAILMGLRNLGK